MLEVKENLSALKKELSRVAALFYTVIIWLGGSGSSAVFRLRLVFEASTLKALQGGQLSNLLFLLHI